MKFITSSFFFLALAAIVSGRAFKKKIGKSSAVDIGFLIENPGNSRPEGHEQREGKDVFTHSQEFVQDLVKNFNVSVPGIHIGVVTFGDRPFMAFDFNEHLSSEEVEKATRGLTRPSRGSHTGRALKFAKDQLFEGSSRPNARKVLVILATQASQGDAPSIADDLKKSGITIYSIAIDSKGGAVELNDLVSEPIEEHKFVTKSENLGSLTSKITNLIIKDHKVPKEALKSSNKNKDIINKGNEETALPKNFEDMDASQDSPNASEDQRGSSEENQPSKDDHRNVELPLEAPKDEPPTPAPRDVEEINEAPKDVEASQEAPKNVEPTNAAPVNSEEPKEAPKDTEDLQEAPKNEEPTIAAPVNSVEPKEAPKDTEDLHLQEAPKNEEPTIAAPVNLEEPKEAPKDTEDLHLREVPKSEESQDAFPVSSEKTKESPKVIEIPKEAANDVESDAGIPKEPSKDIETPKEAPKVEEAPKNVQSYTEMAQTGTPEETESPLNGPMEKEGKETKDVRKEANTSDEAPKDIRPPVKDVSKEVEAPKEEPVNVESTNNIPNDHEAPKPNETPEVPKAIEAPKGSKITQEPNASPVVTEAPMGTQNISPKDSETPLDAPKDSKTPKVDLKNTETLIEAPKDSYEHKESSQKANSTAIESETVIDNITLDEMPEKKANIKPSGQSPTQKDPEPKMSKDALPKFDKSPEPERLPDPQDADPSEARPEMPENEMPKMNNAITHETIVAEGELRKKSSEEPTPDNAASNTAAPITEAPKETKIPDAPAEEAPKETVTPEKTKEAPAMEPIEQIKDNTSTASHPPQTPQEAQSKPAPLSPPKKDPQQHMSIAEPKVPLEEPIPDLPPPDSPPPKKVALKSVEKPSPDNSAPAPIEVPKEAGPDSSAPESTSQNTNPEAPAIEETAIKPAPETQMQPSPDSTVPEEGPESQGLVGQALQEAPKTTSPDSPAPEKGSVEPSTESTPVSNSKSKVAAKPQKKKVTKITKKIHPKDKPIKKSKHKLMQLLTKTKTVRPKMPPPALVASKASYQSPAKRVTMPRANLSSIEENDDSEMGSDTKTDIEYEMQKKLFGVDSNDINKKSKDSNKHSDDDDTDTEQDASPHGHTQPAINVIGKQCKARVDLAFLLDGSKHVGKDHFDRSVEFVKKLIKSFTVSRDQAHVSVAVCSETPHVLFDLKAFDDHKGLDKAMTAISYPKGMLFTGGCLKTIRSGVFENSGRHDVPKILYFISGGKSRDNVDLPSRALRDMGVQVFSLGLGDKYDGRELKTMSTAPYGDHVMATKYSILSLLRPFVTAQLCRGSGGKLVKPGKKVKVATKIVQHHKAKPIQEDNGNSQIKATVPKVDKKTAEEKKKLLKSIKAKRRAILKADIKRKLHILLSNFGKSYHSEKAVYRSIIENINGHQHDPDCIDFHVLCPRWSTEGLCNKSSDGIDFMSVQRVCPKTCKVCYA